MYPTLLHKSQRGKYYNPNSFPEKYGQEEVAEGVEGVELLEAYEKGEIRIDEDGEVLWKTDEIERSDDEEEDESDGSEPPELVEYDEDDDNMEEGDEDQESEEDGDNNEENDAEAGEEGDDGSDGWEECSEDSDEEGEEENDANGEGEDWETCSENEDEDEADANNTSMHSQTSQNPIRLDRQRLLTPEDFSLLEKLKAAQRDRLSDPRNRSKRKRSGEDSDDEENPTSRPAPSYAVTEDQIAPEAKVKKSTKIERLTRVLEGRVENRFVHEGHAGGLTNKEKQRKKNYVMIRKGKREVAAKDRRSNSEVRWQKSKRVSRSDRYHDFTLISVQKEQYGRDRRKRRRT